MTVESNDDSRDSPELDQSPLAFDAGDLLKLRVRPADFARLCGVSKQSVSRWIQLGKLTLGPDGKLDPDAGIQQVIQRSDPARLRARFFKLASEDRSALRKRVERLEAELRRQKAEVLQARNALQDELAYKVHAFCLELESNFPELQKAWTAGDLADHLDQLVGKIIWGLPESNGTE